MKNKILITLFVTLILAGSLGAQTKIYRALIFQSGTNAPVATVLENTLGGDIVWFREDEGLYYGELAGAFPDNKCFIRIGTLGAHTRRHSNDLVMISTPSDFWLFKDPFEIIVYP